MEDERITALNEFNAGWGAARDITDAVEVLRQAYNVRKLMSATEEASSEENKNIEQFQELIQKWNASMDTLRDNLRCRWTQLQRISSEINPESGS